MSAKNDIERRTRYILEHEPQLGEGKHERIASLEEDVAILTDTLTGIEEAIKSNGTEIQCDDILAQFTIDKCYDYGEVKKMVLCTAIRIRNNEEISMEKAIKQAWKEVRDKCR